MKIQGIEGMSPDQLQFEIQRGAKLVCYQYCISILVMTFRRSSDAYFIPCRRKSRFRKDCPGPCSAWLRAGGEFRGDRFSPVQSLVTNFKGGKDLTAEFSARLSRPTAAPAW